MTAVALLAIAACGSTKSSDSASSSPGASGSAASVAYAQQQLAKYSATSAAFTAPGPALKNVASLRGKVVYYVPIGLTVPYFLWGVRSLHVL
jgi:hypothetical protein